MRVLPVLGLAAVLSAQLPEEPTIRVTVANVLLDVVVTDRKGNPVTGLKPTDFRITQDGKPRPVVSANLVELPRQAMAGGVPAPVAGTNQPPRTIAFVVDDLGLSLQSMHSVRESIRRFVEKQLQPTDRVAIVRTAGGISALQQFSSDPNLLRVAAARLRFNPASRVQLEDGFGLKANTMSNAIHHAETRARETSLVGALGTLNLVINALAGVPGRKSVFLFTDGLPVFEKSNGPESGRSANEYEDNPRALGAIRRLTDAASRGAVVVHTIDAKGLLSGGIDITQKYSTDNPDEIRNIKSAREQRLDNALDGLRFIAKQTGGTFTTNNNDLNDAVLKSINGDATYYLLAYEPDAAIFKTPESAFHRLHVSVNRPGVEVRYRSGFFGRADTRDSLARSQQPAPAVNFTLSPAYFQTPEGAVIDAQLLIDAADLTFTAEPDGLQKAVIETNLITFNEQGVPESQLGQDYTLRVKPAQRDELLKAGLVYRVRHPVKKPGAYLMKAIVTDKASRRTGSATHFVEVPDIRKKVLVLSNLTIGRGAETANRVFKPGDTLDYGAQVINSATRALQREVRLYCEGDLTGHFPTAAFEPITVERVAYPVAAGRLQLSPQATPGNYTLELSVIDPAMKGEKGRATQFTTFTVIAR